MVESLRLYEQVLLGVLEDHGGLIGIKPRKHRGRHLLEIRVLWNLGLGFP